jgi:hypothetical protein
MHLLRSFSYDTSPLCALKTPRPHASSVTRSRHRSDAPDPTRLTNISIILRLSIEPHVSPRSVTKTEQGRCIASFPNHRKTWPMISAAKRRRNVPLGVSPLSQESDSGSRREIALPRTCIVADFLHRILIADKLHNLATLYLRAGILCPCPIVLDTVVVGCETCALSAAYFVLSCKLANRLRNWELCSTAESAARGFQFEFPRITSWKDLAASSSTKK